MQRTRLVPENPEIGCPEVDLAMPHTNPSALLERGGRNETLTGPVLHEARGWREFDYIVKQSPLRLVARQEIP